jgi:hypothetical protein
VGEPGVLLLTQSDALGWYTAFLQNAGRGVGGGPRAVLWAGIGCPVGTRGEGRLGTRSGALGWRVGDTIPGAGTERGEPRTGFCVLILLPGGAASVSRYPRLLTGRPYGTIGRVRRVGCAEGAELGLGDPGGRVGRVPSRRSGFPGRVGRGLVGALRARESCNSDSSPEPSAACSEGLVGRGRAGARPYPLWVELLVRRGRERRGLLGALRAQGEL